MSNVSCPWASCIFHSFWISTSYKCYIDLSVNEMQTYFWAGFVMNILSQLHIFTEFIYVPHVKYCARFIMLTSSWLACNKTWYCEKTLCFCNYFIICHEDAHHLLGFRYVVCLFFYGKIFQTYLLKFYVNRSLTILSTQLRFTSQYVNNSHLKSFSTWLMSTKGLPLEFALNMYVLTSFSLIWLLHLQHCWVFYDFRQH